MDKDKSLKRTWKQKHGALHMEWNPFPVPPISARQNIPSPISSSLGPDDHPRFPFSFSVLLNFCLGSIYYLLLQSEFVSTFSPRATTRVQQRIFHVRCSMLHAPCSMLHIASSCLCHLLPLPLPPPRHVPMSLEGE
eukprot:763549-Hanusia_phi.AAC.1